MEISFVLVGLALIQFFVFTGMVGYARGKYKINAPHCTGNEHFERFFRVQQNSMEQLIIFIPSVFGFALLVSPKWVLIPGITFLISRAIYAFLYIKNPDKRSSGFVLTFFSNLTLMLGSLVGAILHLINN